MFKNENSLSQIQMYSGNSKCSRLFLTDQSDQSLNASQHSAIIFIRGDSILNGKSVFVIRREFVLYLWLELFINDCGNV